MTLVDAFVIRGRSTVVAVPAAEQAPQAGQSDLDAIVNAMLLPA